MPRLSDFDLYARPDLGFTTLDQLLSRLREQLQNPDRFGAVLTALQREGRHLDAQQLAADLGLGPAVASLIEQLSGWGDQGELLHHFASVRLATVNAGSALGHTALTTLIFAQRHEYGLTVFFEDENGGHGDLGEFDRTPSLLELIVVADSVLVRQTPYDIIGGDWRSGYFGDPSMTVRLSSPHYRQLSGWYEQAIAEWVAAHPVDAE